MTFRKISKLLPLGGTFNNLLTTKGLVPALVRTRSLATLTMFTKENCSLCEEAKEKLQPFMKRLNFEEVDILAEGNEDWFDKYKYEIPVFHLNDEFLMKYKVNTKLLDKKLTEIEGDEKQ